MAATFHAGLVTIGDRLGLYRAMAGAGGLTPAELAKRTGTHQRYVAESLSAQAAGGYVTYDAATGRFTLPPEQTFVLLDADLPGAFMLGVGSVQDESKIADAFRTGAGVGWHEHDAAVFDGCERSFRPAYAMNLTNQWIPALEGVEARLAQAFPRSIFWGFDYHAKSIDCARRVAEKAGVADRVTFEVAPASKHPGTGYDFVTFFDGLHDMGDPAWRPSMPRSLASRNLSRAVYEWRDAYGLALRARGWEPMADVGDAAVRVKTVMGGAAGRSTGFRAEARRAYIHALLRAQREQSREGVNHIADGFTSLGDTDMAAARAPSERCGEWHAGNVTGIGARSCRLTGPRPALPRPLRDDRPSPRAAGE